MTTHNLEQIARETANIITKGIVAAFNTSVPKWNEQDKQRVPDMENLFTDLILTALRSVAPQPAKTEEVREAVFQAVFRNLNRVSASEAMTGDVLSALTPYLRTDREPCRDSVRLDWLEKNGRKVRLAIGYRGEPDAWGCEVAGVYTEHPSLRAAIDAAASANDGRARG